MRPPEEELKRLLLASELDLLERVRERCDALFARVGDDPSLKDSVRDVIVDVLRESGIQDHDRLARALAPLIVSSMREEIRNSRDMMVDALYPITGQLVAAAVRNAFNELIDKINQRLDQGFSFEVWQAKLRAKLTGRSEGEILLQSSQAFEIEELFVVHRPTGLLIERLTAEDDERKGVDSDLVSGMLTAIIAFVRDAFQDEEGGDLRTLAFGESQLFLRTSPNIVLAAKVHGKPPANFDAALQDTFFGILDRWGGYLSAYDGDAEQTDKQAFSDDLRDRFRSFLADGRRNFRGRSRKAYLVLAIILILLLLWPAYALYQAYTIDALEDRARHIIASDSGLVGYPVDVRYDSDTKALVVEGLLPSGNVQNSLSAELRRQMPDTAFDFQLGSLKQATGDELDRSTLITMNDRLSRLQEDLTKAIASIESKTRSSDQELSDDFKKALGELETTLSQRQQLTKEDLSKAIGRIETAWQKVERRISAMSEITPTQRLRDWVGTNAIFFFDDVEYRDTEVVDAQLRELADLMLAAPADVRLRVVGYTDNTGSLRKNERLSLRRANTVIGKLAELGVPRERLIPVGRSAEKSITSGGTRTVANNRRIEFEVAFKDE